LTESPFSDSGRARPPTPQRRPEPPHAPMIAPAGRGSGAALLGPPLRATGQTCGAPTAASSQWASGTGVGHRAAVVARRVASRTQTRRRRPRGTRCGNLGRHAQVPEDPLDHGLLLDERDQTRQPPLSVVGQMEPLVGDRRSQRVAADALEPVPLPDWHDQARMQIEAVGPRVTAEPRQSMPESAFDRRVIRARGSSIANRQSAIGTLTPASAPRPDRCATRARREGSRRGSRPRRRRGPRRRT